MTSFSRTTHPLACTIDTGSLFRSRVLAIEIFPWRTRQVCTATDNAAGKFWQKQTAIKFPLLREGKGRNSTSRLLRLQPGIRRVTFELQNKRRTATPSEMFRLGQNFKNNCWEFSLKEEKNSSQLL